MLLKVLVLVYASRNGLAETELFSIIPGLTWNLWAPLSAMFADRLVLTIRSGLLTFLHDQV